MARWFLYVFFYSLAGCALEKLYARATHSSRQIRKCFLLLPLCPVYGLAMATVLAVAGPADGFLRLALVGGLICTGVEYLVHLFLGLQPAARACPGTDLPTLCPDLGGAVCNRRPLGASSRGGACGTDSPGAGFPALGRAGGGLCPHSGGASA